MGGGVSKSDPMPQTPKLVAEGALAVRYALCTRKAPLLTGIDAPLQELHPAGDVSTRRCVFVACSFSRGGRVGHGGRRSNSVLRLDV